MPHFLFGFDGEIPRRRTYFDMTVEAVTLNRQYRGVGEEQRWIYELICERR